MEYSLKGTATTESDWIPIVLDTNATNQSTVIPGVSAAQRIRVRYAEDDNHYASPAAGPENLQQYLQPTLTVTQPTTVGGTGSITGTSMAQYQKLVGNDWVDCGDADWTGLTQGQSYSIRRKPCDNYLASEPLVFYIKTVLQTPSNISFVATGYDSGYLTGTGLADGMVYSINGDTAWTALTIEEGKCVIASGVDPDKGILVKQLATDTDVYIDSQPLTISVYRAPTPAGLTAGDCSAGANDGYITGLDANASYELTTDKSAYTAYTSDGTGTITGLAPGSYFVRAAAHDVYLASADTTDALAIKGKKATPAAEFTATGSSSGKLSGLVAGEHYDVTGSAITTALTNAVPDASNEIALTGMQTGTLSVVCKGDGALIENSDAQGFTISKEAEPTSAYFLGTGTTTGQLHNVSSGMKYRIGNGAWQEITGTYAVLEGLSAGVIVDVYQPSSDPATTLDSEAWSRTIYQAYKPTPTFTATGADTGTLGNVSDTMRYRIGNGGWTNAGGNSVTLSNLTAGDTITVYDAPGVRGNLHDCLDSDESDAITITQAAQPTLTVTQPTAAGGTGVVNASAIHEYSTDGGTNWTPVQSEGISLAEGEYLFRVKADDAVLASPAQTVKIGVPYCVTVAGGTVNGQASDYFLAGDVVTVTATVPGDKDFDKWTSDYITSFDTATSATATFYMIAQDVTVTATFKDKASGDNNHSSDSSGSSIGYVPYDPTYPPVIAKTEHGTVTVSPTSPAKGANVTVTLTPDEGYEADTLTITDSRGNPVTATKNADGTYTYKQPEGKVTITGTFKEKAADTPAANEPITLAELLEMFGDLDPNGWYLDGILYCVNNDIMHGMGDGSFGPGLTASRAMMVQILWNMAGNPEPNGDAPFTDVAAGAWYAKAVAWAYQNGVTNGTGVGFEPGLDITREQLAVMLYNYAKLMGKGFQGLWSFHLDFPDAGDVADWATEAMSWMVMNGIINGNVDETGATVLDPQGDATRAQLAAMVHRFCELIK